MSDDSSDDRIREGRRRDRRPRDDDDEERDDRRPPRRKRDEPKKRLTEREAYNLATDLGTGPNIRLRDNLIQAAAIVACMILGAAIGMAFTTELLFGAAVGGGIGMVVGLFGSGLYLMIYRMIKHSRGEHD